MTIPLALTGRSPRADLPFLFAAQAQKEATVNEALARIDALLAPCVEGESAAAPASPSAGESWIVAPAAQGIWEGHEGSLATFVAGTWVFAAPVDGMRTFDRSSGSVRIWIEGWQSVTLPSEPSGGSTIDVEARQAISALIAQLSNIGLGA